MADPSILNRWRDAARDRLSHAPLSRRQLLVAGGAATGLVVAWSLWPRDYDGPSTPDDTTPTFGPFVRIAPDGQVTVAVPQVEQGQGVMTAFAQIVADELGAPWDRMAVIPAPAAAAYANTLITDAKRAALFSGEPLPGVAGRAQRWWSRRDARADAAVVTAWSSSIRVFEKPLRRAAAHARALLTMEAAARWGVDWQACQAADGYVMHGKQKLAFGALAADAATRNAPDKVPFRTPPAEPLIGQALNRLDLPAKLDGRAQFAADIRLPGMVYAALVPLSSAERDTDFDAASARREPGVIKAYATDGSAIVIAENTWIARSVAQKFTAKIAKQPHAFIAATDIAASVGKHSTGSTVAQYGDHKTGREALAEKSSVRLYAIDARAPDPAEPRAVAAHDDQGRLRVWTSCTAPGPARQAIAEATGRSVDDILVIPVFGGDPTGAAIDTRLAVKAAQLAVQMSPRPVQLTLDRANSNAWDLPRPLAAVRIQTAQDATGVVTAWDASISTPSLGPQLRAQLWEGEAPADAARDTRRQYDPGSVTGAMPPYALGFVDIKHGPVGMGAPAGYTRGWPDLATVFATECCIDALSAASELDAVGYRVMMLGDNTALAACLLRAARTAGWDGTKGRNLGMAIHSLRDTHIALVAQARPDGDGIRVEALTAVVDAGRIINPSLARDAIASGLTAGLNAALGTPPTMATMPKIDVVFMDSDRDPGGLTDVGVPVVAPAIANAIASLTGQRLTTIPLVKAQRPMLAP